MVKIDGFIRDTFPSQIHTHTHTHTRAHTHTHTHIHTHIHTHTRHHAAYVHVLWFLDAHPCVAFSPLLPPVVAELVFVQRFVRRRPEGNDTRAVWCGGV